MPDMKKQKSIIHSLIIEISSDPHVQKVSVNSTLNKRYIRDDDTSLVEGYENSEPGNNQIRETADGEESETEDGKERETDDGIERETDNGKGRKTDDGEERETDDGEESRLNEENVSRLNYVDTIEQLKCYKQHC